jgi:hypothetical protein
MMRTGFAGSGQLAAEAGTVKEANAEATHVLKVKRRRRVIEIDVVMEHSLMVFYVR